MSDMNGIEDPFRGYRPVAPPDDLRARVLRASTERPARLRDWLPAVAAAALIALFGALSYRAHADIDARLAVSDDVRPVEQWLPDDAGGLR